MIKKIKAVFTFFLVLISISCPPFAVGASDTFEATRSFVTDSETGRTINCVTVGGRNTVRAYFTQRMWTNDSKRLILGDNTNGYLYEYNTETNLLRQLVKSGGDFYVTPNDYMYYINRTTKTIDRMNLNTYQNEQLTSFVANTGTPSSIHVSHDDGKFAVLWTETANPDFDYATDMDGNRVLRVRRIPVFDINTRQWDLRYTHEFSSPLPYLTHTMINPVYTNLVFFCHEGTTQLIPDRLWLLDTKTGEQKNIFRQHYNSIGGTGETSGHETWVDDGEHMVFVKYTSTNNLGQSGIVRIDKFGEHREYINHDYKYWHCYPSSDNRWVVADTQESMSYNEALGFSTGMTDIVMVDSKTSSSVKVARVLIGANHPWQPHPSFSPDGKKVSFSMINSANVLSVGIVDVSDLVDNGQRKETVNHNVNEDKGFSATSVKLTPTTMGKAKAQTTIHNNKEAKSFTFLSAGYANGKLLEVKSNEKLIGAGESQTLENEMNIIGTGKHFLWNSISKASPYSLEPTAPEKLRAIRISTDNIVLNWAPAENLSDIKEYVVYRDGVEVGRVPDGYFKETGLMKDSTYQYEVRACFESGLLSPPAYGTFTTKGDAYSILDNPMVQQHMSFYVNNSTSADSYTEQAYYGGRFCRKSTAQLQSGGTTKTGKFYFRVDKDYISSLDRNVGFEITYYDEGTASIYVEYNSLTGIAQRVKIADRQNTLTWKSASVSVDNAQFVRAPALTNSDFRIEAGANAYLYQAKVTKLSDTLGAVYQSVYTTLSSNNNASGLTLYEGTATGDYENSVLVMGGQECRFANAGKFFYFDVADSYLFGTSTQGATITFSYFDSGTGKIYLQYNSTDPTMSVGTAYKTLEICNKTNSGTWKTVSVPIIDVGFANAQDYPYYADFRLYGDDGLVLQKVKVLARV